MMGAFPPAAIRGSGQIPCEQRIYQGISSISGHLDEAECKNGEPLEELADQFPEQADQGIVVTETAIFAAEQGMSRRGDRGAQGVRVSAGAPGRTLRPQRRKMIVSIDP